MSPPLKFKPNAAASPASGGSRRRALSSPSFCLGLPLTPLSLSMTYRSSSPSLLAAASDPITGECRRPKPSSAPPMSEVLGEPRHRLSCPARSPGTPPALPARLFLQYRSVSHQEACHRAGRGCGDCAQHARATDMGRPGPIWPLGQVGAARLWAAFGPWTVQCFPISKILFPIKSFRYSFKFLKFIENKIELIKCKVNSFRILVSRYLP
jgi:hypothetical protein